MSDQRWQFSWVDCPCEDARFLCSLSRSYATFNDKRMDKPVPGDSEDAETWKDYFNGLSRKRPLIGFALAIDHCQEPAQRAMEANRWRLVAIGLRGHDRMSKHGKPVFARLYMKKFPKTGEAFPKTDPTSWRPQFFASWSCSFYVVDYEAANLSAHDTFTVTNSGYGDGQSMILSRVPVAKLPTFQIPKEGYHCIAKTPFAYYYLKNAAEVFVEAK